MSRIVHRITHGVAPFAAAVLALQACTDAASPVAPGAAASAARAADERRPAELANVIRFSTDDGGFFVADPESGLAVVEGLPTVPSTFFSCGAGGTSRASTLTWQQVGWIRGVIRANIRGADVNVHVFRLSELDPSAPDPFLDLWCTGTPIAAGTGSVHVHDNDLTGAGQKNNAVTIMIRGTVTDLRTGETLRVTARTHLVQNLAGFPDVEPTVKVEKTYVRLQPIGPR